MTTDAPLYILSRPTATGRLYYLGNNRGWTVSRQLAQRYSTKEWAERVARQYRDGGGSVPVVEKV